MRPAWPLAVLLALALAGCAGGGGPPPGGPTPADVDTSAGAGAISGVVVDEGIRPLAGATVTLVTLGVNATTDDGGLFAFTDLEPGFYAMVASAPLHLPAQVTADVLAGETAKVKVQLLADPNPQPYKVVLKHDGYMQAWATIAEYYVQEATGEEAPLCDCRLAFTPEARPSTVVFEAVWQESLPNPGGFESYWVVEQPDTGAGDAGYCSSPCHGRMGGGDFEGGRPAYARLDGPDEWVVYDQRFQLFVTLFYNGEAPDGWSFVAGDT